MARVVNLLLDTHVLLWVLSEDREPGVDPREAIIDRSDLVLASAIRRSAPAESPSP